MKAVKLLLLEKGAELMHKNGYQNTSIKNIVDAAKVPKGSFYYYFESKEMFGLEIINLFSENIISKLENATSEITQNKITGLYSFFETQFNDIIENNYSGGSALGNFALELADVNDLFCEALNIVYSSIIRIISQVLTNAKDNDEISDEIDCDSFAQFIFYSFEGAIMQMKITKNRNSINNFNKYVFDTMLVD